MANVDNPIGARVISHVTGIAVGTFRRAKIKSGYNKDMIKGDIVKLVADTTQGSEGTYIERAAAGDKNIYGIFMGCSFIDPSTGYTKRTVKWSKGTTVDQGDIDADVIIDKDVELVMQVDGALSGDDINKSIDLAAVVDLPTGAAGSNMELDATSVADGPGQFRILRPYDDPNNDPTEANAEWVVLINESTFSSSDPTPA